jgi:hypothetical protein
MQVVTTFGIMVGIDFYGMFKTFYEIVRVKIKCRSHSRIPSARIFEVGVLFQVKFSIEGPPSVVQVDEPTDGVHPPHPDDHEDQGKEEQEQEEDKMDTDKRQQKHNRGESQVTRNQGSTSNKNRTLAASLLAEKVHDIAHVFMEKGMSLPQVPVS